LLRAEITGTQGEKAILTAEKFQWNVELDESEFVPNIPADYTLTEN
jgi:outer membrane lipoprotein-sorting protein